MIIAQEIVTPISQTIRVGRTTSFICESESSTFVIWTFNGGYLPGNTEVSQEGKHPGLVITGATLNHTGKYQCFTEMALLGVGNLIVNGR